MFHIICHQGMQMKAKMSYYYTPMAKIQNIGNTKCWQGCGTYTAAENAKWYSHFARQCGGFIVQSSSYVSQYLLKRVESLYPHKHLNTDVYSMFMHNCQNIDTAKMLFS